MDNNNELPLENKWVFWYASRKEEIHHIKYEERLVNVSDVNSVKDFFSSFLYIKSLVNLDRNHDFALFKSGYKPLWESCPKSACLFIRFKKNDDLNEISLIWEKLLFALIGEQFNEDSILGGILSIRGRETIIELWFNYDKTEERKLQLVCQMKRVMEFSDNYVVYFKDNELSIQQNSTIRDAETYSFQRK